MSGQVCFILLFLPVFTAIAEDVRKQNEEAAVSDIFNRI